MRLSLELLLWIVKAGVWSVKNLLGWLRYSPPARSIQGGAWPWGGGRKEVERGWGSAGGRWGTAANLRRTPQIFPGWALTHILGPSGSHPSKAVSHLPSDLGTHPLSSLQEMGGRWGSCGFYNHPWPGLRRVSWAALRVWALVLNTLVGRERLSSWSQFLLWGVLMKIWSFSMGWILTQEFPGNIKMSPGLACT